MFSLNKKSAGNAGGKALAEPPLARAENLDGMAPLSQEKRKSKPPTAPAKTVQKKRQAKRTSTSSWWTLKNKATLIAVALGTLPVLVVGGIATAMAGRQITEDVIAQQQQLANAINLQMQDFVTVRLQDPNADSPEAVLGFSEARELSDVINRRIAFLRQGTGAQSSAIQFSVMDNARGSRVFISNAEGDIDTDSQALFPAYEGQKESSTVVTFRDISTQDNRPYLVTYAPVSRVDGLDNDWGVLVYQPMSQAFAVRQSLVFTLLCGTVLTVLFVSTLAAYLSNLATRPILAASRAVAKLGQGKFDTRLKVVGNDELSALGSNINIMADQLENQLQYIEESAQREGLFQVQSAIAQQHQQQREAMQQDLRQLVKSVEGVSQGDLTVRAEVAGGEVGTVADIFDSVVESLHAIVVQTKQSAVQINTSTGSGQQAIRQLSNDAQVQTDDISQTLASVEQISASAQSAAADAQQATWVARQAAITVQRGDLAMNRTINSMAELKATVADTTRKMKQVGKASQEVSQVVMLVNEIALKTKLLAINANIEAARAGEEGQGLAVVASEMVQLAEQSASATKEIEPVVRAIQEGTRSVAELMGESTAYIVSGSSQLDETKESLAQVLSVFDEIERLVASISAAAVSQSATSRTVTELMQKITRASQQTSASLDQVDDTFQSTAEVAQSLAHATQTFKVGSDSL